MWEQDLKMTRRIKEEIIHFQHPETEHPSVLHSFVCRYYWIGLMVICQGCYYQGCGDFETFGFSPGKALSLSGSSQFVPVQTQNGKKTGPSSTVRPWWRWASALPKNTPTSHRRTARTLMCLSPHLLFYHMIPFNSAAPGSVGLRTDLQAGGSFLGHPEQSVAASSTKIAQKIRLSHNPQKKDDLCGQAHCFGGLVKGPYVRPNLDGHLSWLPQILPAVYCIY